MKYETIKKVMAAAVMVAVVALGAACSDGELDLGSGADFSINPYVSITADPMTVAKGESTTLKYVVANAQTVTVKAADGSAFSYDSGEIDVSGATETEGTLTVSELTETTTFVITAAPLSGQADYDVSAPDYVPVNMRLDKSGQIEMPAPAPLPNISGETITDSVTVTVVDDGPLTATLTADPDHISQGESSTLTCTVSPDGATVVVEDSNGQEVVMDENCQATVSPTETTVYMLTATNEITDEQVVVTATVFVDELGADSASITANGQDALVQVDDFTGVVIDYSIMPDNIMVTVETDREDVTCTPALPSEATVFSELSGSSICDLTGDTKFNLVSHIDGVSKVEDAVMVVGASGDGRIAVTARPWAFEGEKVNVAVKAVTAADISLIKKVEIVGMDAMRQPKVETIMAENLTVEPIKRELYVPEDGIIVRKFNKMDEDTAPSWESVKVKAVELAKTNEKRIVKALIDPNDARRTYFGTVTDVSAQGKAFSATTIRMLRNDDLNAGKRELDIDLGYMLTTDIDEYVGMMLAASDQLVGDFKDYPINAIAIEEVEGEGAKGDIFVGTYGALLHSGNDGSSWEIVGNSLWYLAANKNEEGTHESCRGDIAKGTKSAHVNDLTSFVNVCDIVLDGDSLYAATDVGMMVIKDVDAALANPDFDSNIIYNNATALAMPMSFHVVNDIELVEGVLYAAVANGNRAQAPGTARGVYRSMPEAGGVAGISWEKVGEIPGDPDVYYVMADMHDDVATAIYAATETGVYMNDLSTQTWTKVGGLDEPIFTMADDPYSTGDIIAGGNGTVQLTRDAGSIDDDGVVTLTPSDATWNDLVAGGIDGSGKITSIAMSAVKVDGTSSGKDEYLYRAAFGSAGGYLMGDATVETTREYVTDTTTPTDEPNEEESGNDGVQQGEDGESLVYVGDRLGGVLQNIRGKLQN